MRPRTPPDQSQKQVRSTKHLIFSVVGGSGEVTAKGAILVQSYSITGPPVSSTDDSLLTCQGMEYELASTVMDKI